MKFSLDKQEKYSIFQLEEHVDYLYEPVTHLYDPKKQVIAYLKDGQWVLEYPNNLASMESFEAMVDVLKLEMYDLNVLYQHLYNSVLNKAVVNKRVVDDITELVGPEAIAEQEQGWKEFGNAIAEVLNKANRKSKLEIVE